MRMSIIPAMALVAALCGCAAPAAVHVVSFAADGIAYVVTGKGTTDLALSAMAGGNCRLSNAMHGRDLCRPADEGHADVAVASLMPPRGMEIATLERIAPGAVPSPRLAMRESAGMNVAEISGAAPGSRLAAHTDAAGTLHVFLVAPEGQRATNALFTVPGFARNPGAFTGVLMGTDFFAPENFLRWAVPRSRPDFS